MTVNTIYHTSNDAFLIEQELLFQTRPRSRRPSEENYLFEMRPGSIKELFVQEAFREGGWWQLVDESQIIKSCGAYRFKTSLIIGARYYCFKKTEKYRYAFINFLLPKLIKKAEELGCESVVMTFNKYNDSFPRAFEIAMTSELVLPASKVILRKFFSQGERIFKNVPQQIYALKLNVSRQWYEP